MAVRRDRGALPTGTAALEETDWDGARLAFERELEAADAPASHEGLGQALFFLGRVSEALLERESAFDGYVAAGRCDDAARIAVWVSHQHLLAGRVSAARGWLARAERTLDGLQASCPGRGWVAVERAGGATSFGTSASEPATIGTTCLLPLGREQEAANPHEASSGAVFTALPPQSCC